MEFQDKRDAILHAACPMVVAPTFGQFEPMQVPGKRMVAARDGIYLEARSAALHWLLLVSEVPLPYGVVKPFLRAINGPVPSRMFYDIADRSLQASPAEIAFGIQSMQDGSYELKVPVVISANASHVTYHDSFEADHLVFDIHSHGQADAFFSGTDDESDLSRLGPYIAGVIAPRTTYASTRMSFRAVCAPFLIPLEWDEESFKDLIA